MVRLLFDEMVKKTAKWARLFGVDSECAKGNDTEILRHARTNKRILVTRDNNLAARAPKYKVKAVLLTSLAIPEQLFSIEKALRKQVFRFPEATRCPACNGILTIVSRKEVVGKVPDGVYSKQERFWVCKKCGKIYWEGGHWKNITRVYNELKRKRELAT
ncbi:MAG: Mut7-C RNAse domain-containing protein [Candidatus Bilamarchaeaceae archaeon]